MLTRPTQLITSTEFRQAAVRLHAAISSRHWNGTAVVGPDPGIRFNTRVGRFIKSKLNWFPWKDNVSYMQAQGYWIFSNWQIHDATADEKAKTIALACSDYVVNSQESGGFWKYPNREWKGRIATVEGCFATLGLLHSYSKEPREEYINAAIRWFEFLMKDIGFRQQSDDEMLAVNYFAHRGRDGGGVPNNSTLLMWTLAWLSDLTGDTKYLQPCKKMLNWLSHVQLASGELPYALGKTSETDRTHFLCFQYNAFEFMDLVHYHQLTGDEMALPVMEKLAGYLSTGFTNNSTARYDCHHANPDVFYYTCALARALSMATEIGMGDFDDLAEKAYRHVLSQQRPDGGFSYHSRKNYQILSDSRSYPRYLSMILHHLLGESTARRTLENENCAQKA